jgi:hypothetical protein
VNGIALVGVEWGLGGAYGEEGRGGRVIAVDLRCHGGGICWRTGFGMRHML